MIVAKDLKVPSYLSCLLNKSDEEIILVYKVSESLDESFQSPSSKNNDNFLDVTGSPLKVDLNNTSLLSTESVKNLNVWQKEEEQHHPMTYEEARKYIQEYWFSNPQIKKPVWCVCDGNSEKVVLLSALQLANSITRSLVKVNGYLPKNHPSITFDELCNKHYEIIREITGENTKVPLRQMICSVTNTYKLQGTKINVKLDDYNEAEGSVYLETNWNQCCEEIPLDHSSSSMTIQTVVGQKSSPLAQFWNELILLELYIKALHEYNSETMCNNYWLPSNGDTDSDLDLVDRVIETINKGNEPRKFLNPSEGELNLSSIIENTSKRCVYDITDQLWIILSKCSTYGALIDCLNVTFSEIINCNNDIFVADTNKTCMAQIIRDVASGKILAFRLTGTQPIELLIDIGIEKLRKDYSYIFTHFDIASLQDLNEIQSAESKYILESSQIRNALYHKKSLLDFEGIDKRMKILGQFHTAIETISLVPVFWQTLASKSIFDHYVRNSQFDSFSDLGKDKLYELKIDLPIMEIYQYIKTLTPLTWRFSLVLSKALHSVESVFYLSQHPIFPPAISVTDVDVNQGDIQQEYYYYTQLIKMINYIKTTYPD